MNKLAKREQVYCTLITEQDIAKIKKEDRSEISKLDLIKLDLIIRPLIKKYQDRFPKELPPELPPNRKVDHKIELISGAVPPSRGIYSLSPLELEALKVELIELIR